MQLVTDLLAVNIHSTSWDNIHVHITAELLLVTALNSANAEVLNVGAGMDLLCDAYKQESWNPTTVGFGDPLINTGGLSGLASFVRTLVAYADGPDCDPLMSGFLLAMRDLGDPANFRTCLSPSLPGYNFRIRFSG